MEERKVIESPDIRPAPPTREIRRTADGHPQMRWRDWAAMFGIKVEAPAYYGAPDPGEAWVPIDPGIADLLESYERAPAEQRAQAERGQAEARAKKAAADAKLLTAAKALKTTVPELPALMRQLFADAGLS